ncbi:hypothetical protein DFH06DRAFT_1156579 [Mycena polygramma]|nr:hypothetical protein DFH06DRAFT_1156579 [Mycena polygramma]
MSLDFFLFLAILFAILVNKYRSSPPGPSTTKRPCIGCGKLTSLRCSRCHEAYYCSPDHMTSDWKTHKTTCRKFLSALLFPQDSVTPVVVKIPYASKVDTDGFRPALYHDLDLQTLQQYLRGLEMKYVTRFGAHGRLLEHALVVLYSSEWSDIPRNQCIADLTGRRMGIAWAGNVLVLRQKGRLYSEMYESAKMEDVEAIARFFEEYRDFVPYAF